MVPGISTYSFGPQADPLEVLDLGRRWGFGALELGSYTYWPQALSPQQVSRLRTALKEAGFRLSIHFIHRGVDLGAHDPEARREVARQLQETVRLAGLLGGGVVVVHLGAVTRRDAPDAEAARREARDLALDTLRGALPLAEAEGVLLAVENLYLRPPEVLLSYEEYRAFLRDLASPAAGFTLDLGHAHCSTGVEEAVRALGPLVRHLHLHDNSGERDEHREIGRGTLPWERVAGLLGSFPGLAVLETADTTDPEGCVRRSLERLRGLLGG